MEKEYITTKPIPGVPVGTRYTYSHTMEAYEAMDHINAPSYSEQEILDYAEFFKCVSSSEFTLFELQWAFKMGGAGVPFGIALTTIWKARNENPVDNSNYHF